MYPYFERASYSKNQLPFMIYLFESSQSDPSIVLQTNLVEGSQSNTFNKAECKDFLHWHDSYEILYFTSEGPRIEINGHLYHPKSGDILLVDSFDIHKNLSEFPDSHYVLLINSSLLPSSLENQVRFPNGKDFKWLKSNGEYKNYRSNIELIIKNLIKHLSHSDPFILYSDLCLLFSEINNYVTQIERNTNDCSDEKLRDKRALKKIYNYVKTNYTRDISLEEIANLVNFSKPYFCKFIKKTTNQTFLDFLNNYRCHLARNLLESTTLPITTIAIENGFSNVSYFSKVFKKYMGISPSEYRRNIY